jgi:hypothetical protein
MKNYVCLIYLALLYYVLVDEVWVRKARPLLKKAHPRKIATPRE